MATFVYCQDYRPHRTAQEIGHSKIEIWFFIALLGKEGYDHYLAWRFRLPFQTHEHQRGSSKALFLGGPLSRTVTVGYLGPCCGGRRGSFRPPIGWGNHTGNPTGWALKHIDQWHECQATNDLDGNDRLKSAAVATSHPPVTGFTFCKRLQSWLREPCAVIAGALYRGRGVRQGR